MQPSVATNLETETSPGLLSALLGIYGLAYRWFTSYSYGKRLCELLGRSWRIGLWADAFPEAGHASNAKQTQEVAVTPTGQAGPLSSCVKTNAGGSVSLKEMCTAQYFFFCVRKRPGGRNSYTAQNQSKTRLGSWENKQPVRLEWGCEDVSGVVLKITYWQPRLHVISHDASRIMQMVTQSQQTECFLKPLDACRTPPSVKRPLNICAQSVHGKHGTQKLIGWVRASHL